MSIHYSSFIASEKCCYENQIHYFLVIIKWKMVVPLTDQLLCLLGDHLGKNLNRLICSKIDYHKCQNVVVTLVWQTVFQSRLVEESLENLLYSY